jgi:hypothetical protein
MRPVEAGDGAGWGAAGASGTSQGRAGNGPPETWDSAGASDDDAGSDMPPLCEPPEATSVAAQEYCGGCGAAHTPLCCVVQGLCCGDKSFEPLRLDFDACQDAAAECRLPAIAAGAGTAQFYARGYVPAPNDSARSGLILDGQLDPQNRIQIGARLQLNDPKTCPSCMELLGFGLAFEPVQDNLIPELSIVVSTERSQVLIATGSKAVWSEAIDAGSHDYVLERDPDGLARLRIDGAVHVALKLALPNQRSRAVVFGRTDARHALQDRARIDDVFAGSVACERSADWTERSAITLGTTDLVDRRAPSVIAFGAERWLAYQASGIIYTARSTSDPAIYSQVQELGRSGAPFDAHGLDDPEWVQEDRGLALYYTAIDDSGVRSLGRMGFTQGPGSAPREQEQLLAAKDLGMRELFGPSATRDPGGNLVLLATAIDSDGDTRLLILRGLPTVGGGSQRFDRDSRKNVFAVGKRSTKSEFTALGSADLVYRRNQYQMYFAGLSAGRWVTGLLISEDLETWLASGIVLSGLPSAAADVPGTQDPDALIEDNAALSLHYTGFSYDDKATKPRGVLRLERATRIAHAICAGVDCGENTECGPAGCVCARNYVLDGKGACVN